MTNSPYDRGGAPGRNQCRNMLFAHVSRLRRRRPGIILTNDPAIKRPKIRNVDRCLHRIKLPAQPIVAVLFFFF